MAGQVDVDGLKAAVRAYARDRTERIADRFVEVCRGFAPRRTGALADSIQVEQIIESSSGFAARIVVGEPYGAYQNFGTGIYGPNGSPIYPRSGNVLVFDSLFGGGLVFATHVRGTEPTHFWERTVDAWGEIVGAA